MEAQKAGDIDVSVIERCLPLQTLEEVSNFETSLEDEVTYNKFVRSVFLLMGFIIYCINFITQNCRRNTLMYFVVCVFCSSIISLAWVELRERSSK